MPGYRQYRKILLMISVIIPAYNEEKVIRECLESLKNQDFIGSYEIILADNGSTDGTKRVAQELGVNLFPVPKKASPMPGKQEPNPPEEIFWYRRMPTRFILPGGSAGFCISLKAIPRLWL